jgi:O-antigen ligase
LATATAGPRPRRPPYAPRAAARAVPLRIGKLEIAVGALLLGATLFGGLSFFTWRDALLALLAVPALLLALWPTAHRPLPPRRWLIAAAVIAALPLLYLLPLPLDWAAHLPGRAARLDAAQRELGAQAWTTLSLAADDTGQAWLKLMLPLIVFVATLRLDSAARRRLLGLLAGLVLVQALWGLAQLYGGAESVLRFYGADDAYRASGGFANRNHFASLLLLGAPLLGLLALDGRFDREAGKPGHAARLVGALGLMLVLVALLASRSRAAAGLMLIEALLFGAWLLRRRRGAGKLLAGASVLLAGVAALLPFASYRLLGGFELGNADGRLGLLRRAAAAAWEFFPLGAGPGTFESVFRSFDVLQTLDKVYINRAHNDLLELAFELGAVGVALYLLALGALAGCLARNGLRRHGDATGWACSLGVAMLALHGLVDYPLRVPLVAAMAALCAAHALLAARVPAQRVAARPAADDEAPRQRGRSPAPGALA